MSQPYQPCLQNVARWRKAKGEEEEGVRPPPGISCDIALLVPISIEILLVSSRAATRVRLNSSQRAARYQSKHQFLQSDIPPDMIRAHEFGNEGGSLLMPRRIGRRPTRQIVFAGSDPRPNPPSRPNPSTKKATRSSCTEKICETHHHHPSLPRPRSAYLYLRTPSHQESHTISPRGFPPQATYTPCFRAPRQDVAALPTPSATGQPLPPPPTDLAVYPAIAEPTDVRGPCAVSKKKSQGKERSGGSQNSDPSFLLDRRAVACSPQTPRELPSPVGAPGPGQSRGALLSVTRPDACKKDKRDLFHNGRQEWTARMGRVDKRHRRFRRP